MQDKILDVQVSLNFRHISIKKSFVVHPLSKFNWRPVFLWAKPGDSDSASLVFTYRARGDCFTSSSHRLRTRCLAVRQTAPFIDKIFKFLQTPKEFLLWRHSINMLSSWYLHSCFIAEETMAEGWAVTILHLLLTSVSTILGPRADST